MPNRVPMVEILVHAANERRHFLRTVASFGAELCLADGAKVVKITTQKNPRSVSCIAITLSPAYSTALSSA